MLEAYRKHVAERAEIGVVPKPLSAEQVAGLIDLLKQPPAGEEDFLLELLSHRVPPGVDEAAYLKAGFLSALAKGEASSPLIDRRHAVKLLGTMLGGYNIATLVELLDDEQLATDAAKELTNTLLMFDAFHDVAEKADNGNPAAQQVLQSWADAEWFTSKEEIPEKLTVAVFKVPGETNTDDLSPAQDAWSRPDIPLHAKAMYKNPREGVTDAEAQITELEKTGYPVALVGDVMGTGSSRKSATNSVLWYIGNDIPYIPNKRDGGICIAGKIAPIFFKPTSCILKHFIVILKRFRWKKLGTKLDKLFLETMISSRFIRLLNLKSNYSRKISIQALSVIRQMHIHAIQTYLQGLI